MEGVADLIGPIVGAAAGSGSGLFLAFKFFMRSLNSELNGIKEDLSRIEGRADHAHTRLDNFIVKGN